MIQRKTLVLGIKDEQDAINFYTTLIELSESEEEINSYIHILEQEKEHKRILEHKLKTYIEKKGQTDITKLLSI